MTPERADCWPTWPGARRLPLGIAAVSTASPSFRPAATVFYSPPDQVHGNDNTTLS